MKQLWKSEIWFIKQNPKITRLSVLNIWDSLFVTHRKVSQFQIIKAQCLVILMCAYKHRLLPITNWKLREKCTVFLTVYKLTAFPLSIIYYFFSKVAPIETIAVVDFVTESTKTWAGSWLSKRTNSDPRLCSTSLLHLRWPRPPLDPN